MSDPNSTPNRQQPDGTAPTPPPIPVTPPTERPTEANPAGFGAGSPYSTLPPEYSGPPVPYPDPPRQSKLGLVALVLGIIAVICAVVPGLSFVAWIPGLVAAGLGIATLVSKRPHRKAQGIAGLAVGALALPIAIAVSIGAIAGTAGSNDAESHTGTPSSSTEDDSASTTPSAETEVEPEPSPEPEPEPEPAPAPPADVVYTGTGDTVLTIAAPDGVGQAFAATIEHTGARNFAVWSLDANMNQLDLLVNEIGAYSGTVLGDLYGDGATALEITADGNWSVVLKSVTTLPEFTDNAASATGDAVFVYRGAAGVATVEHTGSSNFAIWHYGDQSNLVVNEIGTYSGTRAWAGGPAVIAVSADGAWSITVD